MVKKMLVPFSEFWDADAAVNVHNLAPEQLSKLQECARVFTHRSCREEVDGYQNAMVQLAKRWLQPVVELDEPPPKPDLSNDNGESGPQPPTAPQPPPRGSDTGTF